MTQRDELESAASETAVEENDEPDTMDDHTESCATNKEDDAADKKADEDAACDCGYDDAEAKHYEWEQERDDAIQAAIDRAQEALDWRWVVGLVFRKTCNSYLIEYKGARREVQTESRSRREAH